MTGQIDFTRGGYQGEMTEEAFKPFTSVHMPFWWHFREVLRSSQSVSDRWLSANGVILPDDDQKTLAAISLLNYAACTGIADALGFLDQVKHVLGMPDLSLGLRRYEVLRAWKALYSSLYSGFNALCNIVVVLIDDKSPFGRRPESEVRNYGPGDAKRVAERHTVLAGPINRCIDRLERRSHLDHYWTIRSL
jgi:hypothetical protein